MRRFAALYAELDETTKTGAKVDALAAYFADADPADFEAVIRMLADGAFPTEGAVTRVDRNGTVLVDGRKVFPIVLSKGPERGSTTPWGAGCSSSAPRSRWKRWRC